MPYPWRCDDVNGRIGKHLIAIVFVVHHCCRRDLTDPRMRHKAKSEMKLARVAGSASRAEILCGSGEVASELTSVPATSAQGIRGVRRHRSDGGKTRLSEFRGPSSFSRTRSPGQGRKACSRCSPAPKGPPRPAGAALTERLSELCHLLGVSK